MLCMTLMTMFDEPFMYNKDIPYLVHMNDPSGVLLNSISKYFVETFASIIIRDTGP